MRHSRVPVFLYYSAFTTKYHFDRIFVFHVRFSTVPGFLHAMRVILSKAILLRPLHEIIFTFTPFSLTALVSDAFSERGPGGLVGIALGFFGVFAYFC